MIEWFSAIGLSWFGWALTVEGWISLATLTLLEIVLGIDNLVVLAIMSSRLPADRRPLAQKLGLSGALVLRIAMLFTLVWLTQLTTPVFSIGAYHVSWRDVILILGGLFLLWKATMEVHQEIEGGGDDLVKPKTSSFFGVICMIMVIDFVFALDSIVTAVAMTQWLPVMVMANVIAIVLMMLAARPISIFIEQHPTVKVLALAFILLVGVALVADGFHYHIPREYIYFAIVFSLGVEFLNTLIRNKHNSKKLDPYDIEQP